MCYARRQRSSWARIKLSKSWYQNTDLRPWFNRFRVLLLALYFCLSSILILELFEIRSHILYMLCTSLLLFNFQGSASPPFRGDLLIIPHPLHLVKPFFCFFFKKILDEEQILILSDASPSLCNKSLATETCVPVALCGISVRFQTLFHTQRQVAHALLTRPPLSYLNASRRINQDNSVRLECVMHAASVHPEPGSNSR